MQEDNRGDKRGHQDHIVGKKPKGFIVGSWDSKKADEGNRLVSIGVI